jgi:large subunit ribosomal protein L5
MVTKQQLFYKENVIDKLQTQFSYKNPHEVPKILKIKVNRGLGEAARNSKMLDNSVSELAKITGQKPYIALSKKSIAGFKIRDGMPVGASVTLRRTKMYSFFDKLVNLTLPSIKDFRGISSKNFDGQGNYNFGFKDQLVFPELDYEEIQQLDGLNIAIVTSAKTDEEGYALLKAFGFPFAS